MRIKIVRINCIFTFFLIILDLLNFKLSIVSSIV